LLADLGADVVKIEDPEGGDYIRHMGAMVGETSSLYLALNRNKRSITLDLRKPDDAAALKALVREYDVLIESFRPGVMDKLGCGYEALSKENPRLIYCAITGYGQTGPDRLKAGHDLNYIARAGVLGYGGARDGAPATPGVQIGDVGGGALFGVAGILAALYERQTTGKGRLVDISMTEGAMAFVHLHLGARLAQGKEGAPLARGRESLNGGYGCYGTYPTKDGKYLAVGALEPKFFAKVLAVLERPELMPGAYDTGDEGLRTRAELEKIFRTRTRAEWLELFAAADACVEPVYEGDEVLADPQHEARGMFFDIDGVRQLRTPLHFGELPKKPAPALGADNAEILGSLKKR
jgi:crotonobetainyl-CoA:carnitine CoA-transferase CaiB-like acyl-CoA transferase